MSQFYTHIQLAAERAKSEVDDGKEHLLCASLLSLSLSLH